MIWIGIILFIIGALFCIVSADAEPKVVVGIILVYTGTMIFHSEISEGHPTAIDVYRGKTTLEITYKDSIPVDSVVVFKDKEK